MEIVDIKQQIKTGNFDNFYIFACEDLAVAKLYIDKIVEKSKYNLTYVDSVSDVYSKLKAKSLFSEPYVYVVMNDKEFLNSKYETRWDNIENNIQDDILIVQYTNVDKRIKFWKHFQNRVVFFDHLEQRILKKHIQKTLGARFSDEDCEKLISICESDYGRIMLEADKIQRYADYRWEHSEYRNRDGGMENLKEAFYGLLEDGTIYRPPRDAIFEFAEAVLDRKPKKAYELLDDCYAVGEANMVILSVLYTNFRNLLQVQYCNQSSISKSTGLNGFQIKTAKPYVGRYTDDELVDILGLLNKVQKGIKTGEIADELSIEYVLVNVL